MHGGEHVVAEAHQDPTVAEPKSGWSAQETAGAYTERQQERPAGDVPDGPAALARSRRSAEFATALQQQQQRPDAGARATGEDAAGR